jgi:hypothetical protein
MVSLLLMPSGEDIINVIFPNESVYGFGHKLEVLPLMDYPRLQNRVRKICALVAATLILPALAYADHDSGKGNKEEKDQDKHIPSVPEGGPGIVLLVATIGAVVLFSRRQLRAKA